MRKREVSEILEGLLLEEVIEEVSIANSKQRIYRVI